MLLPVNYLLSLSVSEGIGHSFIVVAYFVEEPALWSNSQDLWIGDVSA
jgi:hypothetical protein